MTPGETLVQAHIDDYAFLIWGLIEIYETTFDPYYLTEALKLNTLLISHFWDEKGGGFYFTADDGEELLVRTKDFYDSAIPSGNSVAMLNLLRLARMTGNIEMENRAMLIGRAVSGSVKQVPKAFTFLISALDFGLGPTYEVVLVGNKEGRDTESMIRALNGEFLPNKVVIFRDTSGDGSLLDSISPFTKELKSLDGNVTAYVCESYACKLPTTEIEKMLELLGVD